MSNQYDRMTNREIEEMDGNERAAEDYAAGPDNGPQPMSRYTGPIVSSYVTHPESGRWWNVSTIVRDPSAIGARGMVYDETIVWAWDNEAKERRAEWCQCRERGLAFHAECVQALYHTGEMPKEEGNE